jgi:hypothetical protein
MTCVTRSLADCAPRVYRAEDREALLGHDVGRLLKQANLILNRQETRTVLRVAIAGIPSLWIKGPAEVPQQEKRPQLRLVTH